MIPFNYHHLYYFYSIVKHGSVTQACQELRLAQPTLSAQLKQFEQFLNLKLFERTGKKLTLTEEGRYVFSYAQEIFDTGREFMDGLNDRSHRHGPLRIQVGISNFMPESFSDALLRFLLRQSPDTSLSMVEDREEDLLEGLKTHQLDLVLTDAPYKGSLDQEIESTPVGRVPIVFCAHPSLARRYRRIPLDLDGAPMILPTSHSRVSHSVQEFFLSHRVKPRVIAEIQDVEIVRRLVLSGAGVAPINLFTVRHAPGREGLAVLGPSSRHTIFENVYVLTKKRKRPHPLVPKVLERFRIAAGRQESLSS